MERILCVPLLLCLYFKRCMARAMRLPLFIGMLLVLVSSLTALGQVQITGKVTSAADGSVMPGVNVIVKHSNRGVTTDAHGEFSIKAAKDEVLVFSFIGFKSREVPVNDNTYLALTLESDIEMLDEVTIYSTGYEELPEERATGSFGHVNNKLLNRSVSPNILSRLDGVTGSLLFDQGRMDRIPSESGPALRIRGMSTLYGSNFSGTVSDKDKPLIIVDNFPYEGDISHINPNDVASITILKDAAAASIWGARAGNGVIVITTKKGNYNDPLQITLNSNVTITQKPDLDYSPEFLSSQEWIEAERGFFDSGLYDYSATDAGFPMITPAVEIMIRQRNGDISDVEAEASLAALAKNDVREDISKYLYRQAINQQYALNLTGGNNVLRYYFSGGYDKNLMSVKGREQERLTFNTFNTLRPMDKLQLSFGMYYTKQRHEDQGMSIVELTHYGKNMLPYTQLADETGNPLPILYQYRSSYVENAEQQGLLNWQYKPLEDRNMRSNVYVSQENRFNIGANYEIAEGLQFDLKYQSQEINGNRELIREKESYQVRDLVNRFTQADGSLIFPYGAMLWKEEHLTSSKSGRGQLTFNRDIFKTSRVAAVAGVEIREVISEGYATEFYGYDPDVLTYTEQFDYTTYYPTLPQYSSRIPIPYSNINGTIDRYQSYYGNVSYTYDDRYTISGSIREDASNLFGVNSNQKRVPLWSVGGAWVTSNESFYDISWLSYLKLRLTYGYSGNVDKSATAFTTARYGTDIYTDLPYATIVGPGNPDLRWEKVGILNAAIDFEIMDGLFSGSIEYYDKNSEDLLAPIPLDPTTGFLDRYTINYADLSTRGIEIQLNSNVNLGAVRWESNIIFNRIRDEVTDFKWDGGGSWGWFFDESTLPQEGEPLYMLYSIPWKGLDHDTGDPIVHVEGLPSTNYTAFINNIDSASELKAHGPKVPPYFGAFRNTFTWKGFSLSANLVWKAGHYFRRNALEYHKMYNNWQGHSEFSNRWQKPGDEAHTNVPSMPVGNPISARDYVYTYSEINVEKGDHIRLQDISLSYELFQRDLEKLPFERVKLYFYASNLGIIWRANDKNLDPDYPNSLYPPQKSYSLGFQVTF